MGPHKFLLEKKTNLIILCEYGLIKFAHAIPAVCNPPK